MTLSKFDIELIEMIRHHMAQFTEEIYQNECPKYQHQWTDYFDKTRSTLEFWPNKNFTHFNVFGLINGCKMY